MKTLLRETSYLTDIGLSDADLARATGAAKSTARAWIKETNVPTGARAERIIELATMVERLERVMERDYISVWLRKPMPMLDEEKPLDLIGRGDYRRVGQVISGLEDPGAS
jgi:uncharacterized protein (DUF2384 family)